jgi:hypothetical protein
MMTMTVTDVDLQITREPLTKPFGFKGNYFTEKWICRADLEDTSGFRASGLGGLAVLWSDGEVFKAHSEVGGNILMAAMLEYALQQAKKPPFETPMDLLDRVLPEVHEFGRMVTKKPDLRKTFALNSLVALDNAAWMLYANNLHTNSFDDIIPANYRSAFTCRHSRLESVPLISYGRDIEEVVRLADGGTFFFKIKIGAPGNPQEMLQADKDRLKEIHLAIGDRQTEYTDDGHIRYYLDANGRYPSIEYLSDLLDFTRTIGMFDQIAILEEPLPEENPQPVGDLGITVAVDESIEGPSDLERKYQLGYRAAALKPAGKTLSMTLRIAQAAADRNMQMYVADSTCPPLLVDWNKNVAARLPALPGIKLGLMESNGAQNYCNWDKLMSEHPSRDGAWLQPAEGVFTLDEEFYHTSGGIFLT